ncbi:glyoxalase [Sinomonas cellulolyticus]|jgi:catechol 2,3-dioxygenase-like lactoylglutathione lyase family enzyme|uniref:VOC family protein n=1 Tax=Sinomonas cellulolyticus TaxID=2801916 RepID=A0ABS1K3D9_9MICC|nr:MULTISPECIES: VOC family protein [Sinomonas]MBL0706145.1 VOC family protein [Sinomonas cellulolyticus]GHG55188.1 glyoxalase [Sinomonas sp. KCTC 49339]
MTSTVEMRLELIHVPVSDVDRARDFYVEKCGWQLLTDHVQMNDMRIVQICPPGSGCAILLGRNIPEISDMPVGVQKGLHLVVANMDEAVADLSGRGVELGEVQDLGGVLYCRFEDPDGNSWLLQQWAEGGFPHE